jgi:hypothetical protein
MTPPGSSSEFEAVKDEIKEELEAAQQRGLQAARVRGARQSHEEEGGRGGTRGRPGAAQLPAHRVERHQRVRDVGLHHGIGLDRRAWNFFTDNEDKVPDGVKDPSWLWSHLASVPPGVWFGLIALVLGFIAYQQPVRAAQDGRRHQDGGAQVTLLFTLFRAMPLVSRLITIGIIVSLLGGIYAGWHIHVYRNGYRAAIAAIAKQDAKAIAAATAARGALADCSHSRAALGPIYRASVKGGECRVFERPQYAVLGKRQYDQRWIDGNVEAGVGACGWKRPAKRPAALDAMPSGRPLVVVPQRRASLMSRTFGRLHRAPVPRARPGQRRPVPPEAPRPANIVVPDVLAVPEPEPEAAPPPPPPRAPVDELLSPTYLLAIGITPTLFMLSMFLVGFVRVGALYYNGWGLPWSARLRALCAIFGAVTFGHLGLSLAWLTKDTGAISLGVGTHVVLAITELYSVLRAGADVNESYHRRLSTGAP